jgi:hypothetical protein
MTMPANILCSLPSGLQLYWSDTTGKLAGVAGANPGSEQQLSLNGSNSAGNPPAAVTNGGYGGYGGVGYGYTQVASLLWASARAATSSGPPWTPGAPNAGNLINAYISSGQIIVLNP